MTTSAGPSAVGAGPPGGAAEQDGEAQGVRDAGEPADGAEADLVGQRTEQRDLRHGGGGELVVDPGGGSWSSRARFDARTRQHVGSLEGNINLGHSSAPVGARAFWLRAPGEGEIRTVELPAPGPDDVVVRTRFSAVSRGTETLVFRGGVPASQHSRMRAPFQEGDFPAPVKYGYLNVGVVEEGPAGAGRADGVLPRTRTRPATSSRRRAVTPVPDAVPAARAVLAGTVETAVNALWDAAPLVGDRIAVVGGGHGRLLRGRGARPASRASRVELVDVDPARAGVAAGARRRLRRPDDAAGDCDLVVHASATERRAGAVAGAARRRRAGDRAELVRRPAGQRCRWARPSTPGAWSIRSSQVGTVVAGPPGPPRPTPTGWRWRCDLLADPAFDALITRRVRLRASCPGDARLIAR